MFDTSVQVVGSRSPHREIIAMVTLRYSYSLVTVTLNYDKLDVSVR